MVRSCSTRPIQVENHPSPSIRNGFLCTLVFLACYLASWPFAEMGFVDDWSYAKSAQVFARTGHLVYCGWDTPILGWLIAWGAFFVRLFGFSFTTVKLSTLPVAMATVFFFHSLLVRFGSSSRNAVIGALTLGLSPLFLPLAASYMTDVPGLFIVVLCLYCCRRAVDAQSTAATHAWLTLAASANVVGGTVRQAVWLGALVMVPATAWFLRKRRAVLATGALLWLGSLAAIFAMERWFNRQPYALPVPNLISGPLLGISLRAVAGLVSEFLCLALLIYPLLLPWLTRLRRIPSRRLADLAVALLLWTLLQVKFHWSLPWTPHILTSEFAKTRNADALAAGFASFLLPLWARLFFSALLLVTLAAVLPALRDRFRAIAAWPASPEFWLLAPFSLAYLALLLPLAMQF